MPLVNGGVQPCSGFPNRSSIPIELYMSHNTVNKDTNWFFANSCGANVACAKNDVEIWNPIVGHFDRRDSYQWYPEHVLFINTGSGGSHAQHNASQRSYVVSHEFGHTFGLDDGGQKGDSLCDLSIMHAGKTTIAGGVTVGCVGPITVFWPKQIDRNVVIGIANNG